MNRRRVTVVMAFLLAVMVIVGEADCNTPSRLRYDAVMAREKKSSALRILGVHRVMPSARLLRETIEALYGYLVGKDDRAAAREIVSGHFAGLHLIVVELDPPTAEFDWGKVTQEVPRQPRSNWQVPYDARPLDEQNACWTFFFHELDFSKPLLTPGGQLKIPKASRMPPHLRRIKYRAP